MIMAYLERIPVLGDNRKLRGAITEIHDCVPALKVHGKLLACYAARRKQSFQAAVTEPKPGRVRWWRIISTLTAL